MAQKNESSVSIFQIFSISLHKTKLYMEIIALSDMHGQMDFKVDSCDLVLIAGDIIPLNIQNYTKPSLTWLRTVFIPWCEELPCDHVVFVGGNHDWVMERHPNDIYKMTEETSKITYLCNDTYEYKGKKIFGTPLCSPFFHWAFMPPLSEQDSLFEKIADEIGNVDILLSHNPPQGACDILLQKDYLYATNEHIGSPSITNLIHKINPQYCFCGHLHSGNHECEKIGETQVYNVSLVNENYNMVYKPLKIEI